MNTVRATLALGISAPILLLSAAAHGAPSKIVYPNPAYPNLQAAVDAVANGGTVQIKTGVHFDSGFEDRKNKAPF